MYNIKIIKVDIVTKQLILFLSFLFISCSSGEKHENNSSNTIIKKTALLKISNESKDEIAEIYTNYNEAFSLAKSENKAVFILFSTEYCRWCTKLKETTLKDSKLKSRLEKEFIVLFLDRDKDSYPSKYKVKGVPAVYMTDKNEEVFTSMVGYHKNPKDYLKWFTYIKVELEN
jgi:thioredoxin-related protein